MTNSWRNLLIALLSLWMIVLGRQVLAQSILIAENQPLLCDNVKQYVSPNKFYDMILAEAKIPRGLLPKAPEEPKKTTIPNLSVVHPEELIRKRETRKLREAVLSSKFPASDLIPNAGKKLEAMRKLKNKILDMTDDAISFVVAENQGYVRVNEAGSPKQFLLHELGDPGVFSLKCKKPSERVQTAKKSKEINKEIRKVFIDFRLRKTVEELSISTGESPDLSVKDLTKEVSSAKLAKFSFTRDFEKDSKSASFEGVAGYRIGEFTPHIAYKFQNQDGRKKDIQIVSPGILHDRVFKNVIGAASVHLKSRAFGVLDLEQNGERLAVNVSAEPGISVAKGLRLGAYDYLLGSPILMRPVINFITEGSYILNAAENEKFRSASDFIGLGGSAGLKFKWPGIPIIESATLSAEFWYLHLFGSDDLNLDRLEVSLDWSPKEAPYFGISASYEQGENKMSFQDEDVVKLGVGVRF